MEWSADIRISVNYLSWNGLIVDELSEGFRQLCGDAAQDCLHGGGNRGNRVGVGQVGGQCLSSAQLVKLGLINRHFHHLENSNATTDWIWENEFFHRENVFPSGDNTTALYCIIVSLLCAM